VSQLLPSAQYGWDMKKLFRKPAILRSVLTLLLLCVIVTCTPVRAAAPSGGLFTECWEWWEITTEWEENAATYEMICPERNVSAARMQEILLDIMSYCRAKNPSASRIRIRFPYDGGDSGAIYEEISRAVSISTGLRAVCSSFLNLSSCKLRYSGGNLKEVLAVLDVNNPESASPFAPDIAYGAALSAAKTLAQQIQEETSDPHEQLKLLNHFMTQNVTYGSTEERGRAHSIVGALLDGRAMCAGFASTVNDICYLLDIPCYQLYDKKNNHIWNVVWVEGAWKMLDCTWNNSGKTEAYFLQAEFLEDGHDYSQETLTTMEGHMNYFNRTRYAAESLSAAGIISENTDYTLTKALTYEELAVVLMKLHVCGDISRVDMSEFARLANQSGAEDWAAPYVGYCIKEQFFSEKLDLKQEKRVAVEVACQAILRCMKKTPDDTRRTVNLVSGRAHGIYMLRGDFFAMVCEWMSST